MDYLTKEQLKEKSSAVFAENAFKGVSNKYTFVPTSQIVDDLDTLGWKPVFVKETKTRKEDWIGYNQHFIRFRNEQYMNLNLNEAVQPEVIIYTSHLGRHSLKILQGLWRQVCSNGLILKISDFGSAKITHIGSTLPEIQQIVEGYVKSFSGVVDNIKSYQNTILEKKDKINFAKDCIRIKNLDNKDKKIEKELCESYLLPVRKEDEGDSLWSVFNVVQDKIMKGGVETLSENGRKSKTRKIINIKKEVNINVALWSLLDSYVKR